MAENPVDLSQLITINDQNLQDVDVPNFLNDSPFMRTNAATIASNGTLHKWLMYQNPAVGFRNLNDGREVQSSTDTMVTSTLEILDASFRCDQAAASDYRFGRDAFINREAGRHLNAAFFKAEQQCFGGTVEGDPTGFLGLSDWPFLSSLAGGMVVNGGGAANCSSIWLIRSGEMDVEIITGRDGNIEIGEPASVEATGPTIGTYPAWYTPITAWYALKVGSEVTSAARVANIDVTATTGIDELVYEAIAKFGSGRQPTHIYCHRLTLERWRSGRQTFNPVGTPAPRMDSFEGIPVITSDGVITDETPLL